MPLRSRPLLIALAAGLLLALGAAAVLVGALFAEPDRDCGSVISADSVAAWRKVDVARADVRENEPGCEVTWHRRDDRLLLGLTIGRNEAGAAARADERAQGDPTRIESWTGAPGETVLIVRLSEWQEYVIVALDETGWAELSIPDKVEGDAEHWAGELAHRRAEALAAM